MEKEKSKGPQKGPPFSNQRSYASDFLLSAIYISFFISELPAILFKLHNPSSQ